MLNEYSQEINFRKEERIKDESYKKDFLREPLSLSLSLSFSKMEFKFFQFEESFYNFKKNIKLINKLNMYDFVDSFRN